MANLYPNVTLLITHYNRPNSLERLLESFDELNFSFAEIIVSDDGSKEEHVIALRKLQEEKQFKLITASCNKGLGNNINKGQDEVKTDFTLYIQEDFTPTPEFIQVLKDSVELFDEDADLDLIRYFALITFPYLRVFKRDFLEMYIPKFATRYLKIYMYSDTPHLRRTSFFSKFGRYKENIGGDRMEYWMCVSFIQNKGKSLIHKNYRTLFNHVNSEEEPSTIPRAMWRQKNALYINLIRNVYRQIRYNFDLKFRCALVMPLLDFTTKDNFLSSIL